MVKRGHFAWFGIGLFLLVTGCVKEYPFDGEPEKGLRLFLTPGAGVVDLSGVGLLDIFAYNEDSLLIQHWQFGEEEIKEGERLLLPLDTGRYHIAAWANVDVHYRYSPWSIGSTRFRDMWVQMNHDESPLANLQTRVLYTHTAAVAEIADGRFNDLSLPLNQRTHLIQVSTRGLYADPESVYELKFSDGADGHYFNGEPHAAMQVYQVPCTMDNERQLHGSVRLPLIDDRHNSVLMSLYNTTTGHKLYEEDLGDLLLKLRDSDEKIDLEDMSEFAVLLSFNAATSTVTVYVNGWAVVVYDTPIYG